MPCLVTLPYTTPRSGEKRSASASATRSNTVRPFLSRLGEHDALGAAPAGRRLPKAVRRLPALRASLPS